MGQKAYDSDGGSVGREGTFLIKWNKNSFLGARRKSLVLLTPLLVHCVKADTQLSPLIPDRVDRTSETLLRVIRLPL